MSEEYRNRSWMSPSFDKIKVDLKTNGNTDTTTNSHAIKPIEKLMYENRILDRRGEGADGLLLSNAKKATSSGIAINKDIQDIAANHQSPPVIQENSHSENLNMFNFDKSFQSTQIDQLGSFYRQNQSSLTSIRHKN